MADIILASAIYADRGDITRGPAGIRLFKRLALVSRAADTLVARYITFSRHWLMIFRRQTGAH